jgi:hypothetical protein
MPFRYPRLDSNLIEYRTDNPNIKIAYYLKFVLKLYKLILCQEPFIVKNNLNCDINKLLSKVLVTYIQKEKKKLSVCSKYWPCNVKF